MGRRSAVLAAGARQLLAGTHAASSALRRHAWALAHAALDSGSPPRQLRGYALVRRRMRRHRNRAAAALCALPVLAASAAALHLLARVSECCRGTQLRALYPVRFRGRRSTAEPGAQTA